MSEFIEATPEADEMIWRFCFRRRSINNSEFIEKNQTNVELDKELRLKALEELTAISQEMGLYD